MNYAIFTACGFVLYILLCFWAHGRLRYQLTPRHFKITLFGLALRRVPLGQIHSVSKRRPKGWAENWCNTLHHSHRTMVIRRHRGLRKFLVFTPDNRYAFKMELERILERLKPQEMPARPEIETAATHTPQPSLSNLASPHS